jgi:hypothetical protein
MDADQLRSRLRFILRDGDEGRHRYCAWCGCGGGDTEGRFEDRRERAVSAIIALISETIDSVLYPERQAAMMKEGTYPRAEE